MACDDRRNPRLGGLGVAALAMGFMLTPGVASGQTVVVELNEKTDDQPKSATAELVVKATGRKGRGSVRTVFDFHPADTADWEEYRKDAKDGGGVVPASITQAYSKAELHGTSGDAKHTLGMTVTGRKISVTDEVRGTIRPGNNFSPTDPVVSIKAELTDPLSFSDLDDGAMFGFLASGMNTSLSLQSGTAFPDAFGNPTSGGAWAEGCSMRFSRRVVPGVVEDPGLFWSSGLAGAINLYELTVTIDEEHRVAADLSFGSSNEFFRLDFAGHDGTPFDPTDPLQVGLIEHGIASAFITGALLDDLFDIFYVGFVPQGDLAEFSLGGSSEINVAAVETPSPGAVSVMLVAATWTLRRRRGANG